MRQLVLVFFLFSFCKIVLAQNEFEKDVCWGVDFQRIKKLDINDWNVGHNLYDTICRSVFDARVLNIESGYLSIKAIKVLSEDGISVVKEGYLNTYKKHSFRYGKFDFLVKSSIGKGVWPAIWLVCADRKNYPRGEIDVFEYNGCWERSKMQGNIHYVASPQERKMFTQYLYVDVTQFHLYTLEWTKDEIRLKVDGQLLLTYTKDNPNGWIFDKDYYLILNMAFGKGWGASCGIDETSLPCSMDIAWIKYYKLKQQ